ncbi:RNA polymerase sigma factor [Streptomyces sp. NPDC058440]|uniref:RNA polymerase sigma factor n=1 Tax=Streptomyces sp. NPDC058440 TaxID=3346501 RepID=UPI00364627EC
MSSSLEAGGPEETDEDAFDLRAPMCLHAFETRYRQKVVRSLSSFLSSGFTREDLEELADEAFMRAESSGRLDPTRDPVSYICTTAKRLAGKALNARKRRPQEVSFGEVAKMPEPRGASEEEPDVTGLGRAVSGLSDEELKRKAMAAFEGISAPQTREVVRRRVLDDESATHVAEDLGVPRNQVDQQLHRGLKIMRSNSEIAPYVRASYVQKQRKGQGGG